MENLKCTKCQSTRIYVTLNPDCIEFPISGLALRCVTCNYTMAMEMCHEQKLYVAKVIGGFAAKIVEGVEHEKQANEMNFPPPPDDLALEPEPNFRCEHCGCEETPFAEHTGTWPACPQCKGI